MRDFSSNETIDARNGQFESAFDFSHSATKLPRAPRRGSEGGTLMTRCHPRMHTRMRMHTQIRGDNRARVMKKIINQTYPPLGRPLE
jgi:predicted HicB family RNase H-like nuclease